MDHSLKITFFPEKKACFCLPGTSVLEAAAECGIIINTPCGGEGICGKCRIQVVKGKTRAPARPKGLISRRDWEKGVRLACQTRIFSSAAIEVSVASRFFAERLIPTKKKIKKRRPVAVDCGLAFDIGTTTVVGVLLNLATGEELAEISRLNPQAVYGDDVISRINYVRTNENGLKELHSRIIATINEMVADLIQQAEMERGRIQKVTVAGNSAMQHLFLKEDPSGLGALPFRPAVTGEVETTAAELAIALEPETPVFVFPSIAGFVGGDAVAVILATGIYRKVRRSRLVVDVGTNGEIVLSTEDCLLCASAAAGPAFEGARISRGMRAQEGAVEKVVVDDDVAINVIGNALPTGICGSGLIDCVSELLKADIITREGRIRSRKELTGKISSRLGKRIVRDGPVNKFMLTGPGQTGDGKAIYLTQRDVREFQVAKAALRAGVKLLARKAGIEERGIVEVMLAGAFGNFIRPLAARRVGLIPELDVHRTKFIGNAALTGAKAVLLSSSSRRALKLVCRRAEHVNLSASKDFQQEFVEAMLFNP